MARYILRCPRLRGDGPIRPGNPPPSSWVSPPTRGWSVTAVPQFEVAAGVPAYAGMVLPTPTGCALCIWCPRLRGDGPATLTIDGEVALVSPPTRGWSLLEVERRAPQQGVPAYAGMVLSTMAMAGWR